jgi:hypothetical protein
MSRLRDVVKKAQERSMTDEKRENGNNSAQYGCEILLQKTTLEQAKDKSFPNDAHLIWYNVGEEQCLDLVRGSRVRIFDMYYDKYGPGAVKKIDWGYGRVSPKLWGYKEPEKKKRR